MNEIDAKKLATVMRQRDDVDWAVGLPWPWAILVRRDDGTLLRFDSLGRWQQYEERKESLRCAA